jgi:hypothetical protein
MTIPRLLPETTIKTVRSRLEAGRTFLRKGGKRVNDYLLSGYVRCEVCGFALVGQTDCHGVPHYSHSHHADKEGKGGSRNCTAYPRPWVRADKLEQQVMLQLFQTFGNPAAIQRAIKAAVPDCDKALDRKRRLEGELDGITKARNRVLGLISRDAVTDKQAEDSLRDLKRREESLRTELDRLSAELADVPDEESLRVYYEKVRDTVWVFDEQGDKRPGGNDISTWLMMTREDKRNLLRAVFANHLLSDGRHAGVYVSLDGEARPYRPKKWSFKILGRVEFELIVSCACPSPRTCSPC